MVYGIFLVRIRSNVMKFKIDDNIYDSELDDNDVFTSVSLDTDEIRAMPDDKLILLLKEIYLSGWHDGYHNS